MTMVSSLPRFSVVGITAVFGLITTAAVAGTRDYLSDGGAVYLYYVTIPTSSTAIFQTKSCTSSADPAFHLLRDNLNGTYTQVAFNDDWSGVDARISYTNSLAATNFILFMRAKNSTTAGKCAVLKDGVTVDSGAPVGGDLVPASTFTWATGNEMWAVHVPGGGLMPSIFRFATTTSNLTHFVIGNGAGGSSHYTMTSTQAYFLFATPFVRNGSTYIKPRVGSGLARVLSNDVASDSDGDGLGDALEATLETCPSPVPDACPHQAYHGRDSDRDGLSDREEVLGVAGNLPGGVDDIPFARWGANPLRKDIFIELDYFSTLDGGYLDPSENPFEWLRANPWTLGGFWYGTVESWYDAAVATFAAAPNEHIENPDESTGVSVHFDLGVAPSSPSNESKFGAYSTGSARILVPDLVVKVTEPIVGDVTVKINGQVQTFDATPFNESQIAALIGFAAEFTGEPVEVTSVITDPNGDTTVIIAAEHDGVHFDRQIVVPSGFEGSLSIVPESNASLRDHYYADSGQFDPTRRGLLRYGIITDLSGGGQASGPVQVSGLNHGSLIHELGHTLGIQHWGHNAWGTQGPDCIPHYFSLMRYGGPWQFSVVDTAATLNPAITVEQETFGPEFTYAPFADEPYNYTVSSNTVDWNRDGSPESGAAEYRTPSLSLYNSSCGAFVQGSQPLSNSDSIVGPVDLVRAGNRIYAVWVDGTEIKYQFATHGAMGNKGCTGSPDPSGGACLTWSSTYTLVAGGTPQGISIYSFEGNLWTAERSSANQLTIRRNTINGNGTLSQWQSWSMSTQSPSSQASRTPEITQLHTSSYVGQLAVLYVDGSGLLRRYRWSGGVWIGAAMVDTASNPMFVGESPVAKAWPDDFVTGFSSNQKRTAAIIPETDGDLAFFVLEYSSGRWAPVSLGLDVKTTTKPFLEYRPLRDSTGSATPDFDGHFMIGWTEDNPATAELKAVPKFRFTSIRDKANPPDSGTMVLLNAGDYLHNLWAFGQLGTSPSLYSDSTLDNVFGLVAAESGVQFYAHADGSPDHDYSVFSDFRIMEDYICSVIGGVRGFACGNINVLD